MPYVSYVCLKLGTVHRKEGFSIFPKFKRVLKHSLYVMGTEHPLASYSASALGSLWLSVSYLKQKDIPKTLRTFH